MAQRRAAAGWPIDRGVRRQGTAEGGLLRRGRRRIVEDHRRRRRVDAGHRRTDHHLVGRRGRRVGVEAGRGLHRHRRVVHPRQHHAGRRRLQIRATPARPGSTSASATPTRSPGSASTRPTRTSSSLPTSDGTGRPATSAVSTRAPTAARRGNGSCSRTTRPEPSTSPSIAVIPNVMFAAMWEAYRVEYQMSSGGPGSGLYKSVDGGETWKDISHTGGLPQGLYGKIGVAISGADSNRVYALVENENGGLFSLRRCGRDLETGERRAQRQAARLLLHPRFCRSQPQGHDLHAEHQRLPLGGRRQDPGQHERQQQHARRPSRPVDRSGRLPSTSRSPTTAAARSPTTCRRRSATGRDRVLRPASSIT